jgi:hypothetical protein
MNPAIYYLSTLAQKPLFVYSLRRVVSGYTGPAIRVRRGNSTTTFQDFYFNSAGELDQASILSFLGAGNVGYVNILYDQSGNGVNLGPSGAVVGREPRIVNAGTPNGTIITKNGKIALSFTANLDNLRTGEIIEYDSNDLSTFVVYSNTNNTGARAVVSILNVSSVSEITFPRPNGGTDYYNYNGGDRINIGQTNADNKVYSSLSTPTSISAWKNNVLISGSPLSITNNSIAKEIAIGNNYNIGFFGTIQELLIYKGDVPSRTSITSEIMSYYNIT